MSEHSGGKRVLLTGAAGVVGRHAISALQQRGYEVHAVFHARPPVATASSSVRWHQCDLLDPVSSDRLVNEIAPSHLLHFAWYTAHGQYWTSRENVRWLQASLGLFDSFSRGGGARAVIAGSCAEYDWSGGCCDESTTPLVPVSVYGTCKHALRLVTDSISTQLRVSAAWGRIFFPFGPGEYRERLVASVITNILRGEPARCSPGLQARDFMYAGDVASAFVALLDSEVEGAVNIAAGTALSVGELVQTIARRMGRPELVQLGALPAAKDDPPVLVADVRRLRECVGWSPEYRLEDALDQTISWWKHESAK